MLRVTLRTRPTVVLGDDIAYRTEYSSRVPAGGTWWLELQHAAWLDGKQVHGASGSSGPPGAAGASGSTVLKTPASTRCQ